MKPQLTADGIESLVAAGPHETFGVVFPHLWVIEIVLGVAVHPGFIVVMVDDNSV